MMDTLTGSFGIVILADGHVARIASGLAEAAECNDLQYSVTVPHITLYHANFIGLPRAHARQILQRTQAHVPQTVRLSRVSCFGGHFLFWHALEPAVLKQVHEIALELSAHVDPACTARAHDETLSLSARQREYMSKYGHPLVLDEFLPHITLVYDANPNLSFTRRSSKYPATMHSSQVVFAEIEEFGSVKQVIGL